MSQDARYVCRPCGVELRPEDDDAVAYAEQIPAEGMQTGPMLADGMRSLFHEGCAPHPADPRWRRVPKN
jgi:hypothetical protein